MKTQHFHRLPPALLMAGVALASSAAAHPGDHTTTTQESAVFSGLTHFLTNIDHVGPVIVVLLLMLAFSRRRQATSLGKN